MNQMSINEGKFSEEEEIKQEETNEGITGNQIEQE